MRHEFATVRPEQTILKRLEREFWLFFSPWIPWSFAYIVMPGFFVMLGIITGNMDENGENFTNAGFFLAELLQIEGPFYFYNLFNWQGYFKFLFDIVMLYLFFWLEPILIPILLLTGDLKVV